MSAGIKRSLTGISTSPFKILNMLKGLEFLQVSPAQVLNERYHTDCLSIILSDKTSPIDLPSPVTQIGLSAAAPDLLDILSGYTGGMQSSAKR